MTPTTPWAWVGQLPDTREWLATSDDPAARWSVLTGVLDGAPADPPVVAAHQAMLSDPATKDLLDRLADWDSGGPLSGHDSPRYAPNLLNLLADRGLRSGDDPRVDRVLGQMLDHQEPSGRFASFAPPRGAEQPVWGSLLCDSHAVVDVLLRYGHGGDPRVEVALATMAADLTDTGQGRAWPCLPHSTTGFRGPGRIGDTCPQVTLEALRAFSRVPDAQRPPALLDTARVCLQLWRRRGTLKPYMFGHGKAFKTIKWPPTWYGAYAVLDSLGRYPALWRGPDAVDEDRRALAELVACLIAYNTDDQGRVVPRSAYRGFESHTFGQKKLPSAFATALLLTVLRRLDDLAPEVAAVDVMALGSSKGGTGRVVPPRAVSTAP